jgi:two-component system, NtrC family, nitrogen regulation sensor histidine kinase GlnL
VSGLRQIPAQKASNDDAPHNNLDIQAAHRPDDDSDLIFNPMDILDSFHSPLLVVAAVGRIVYANVAAENFFSTSNNILKRMQIVTLIRPHDTKSALADGRWNSGSRISETGVKAENHRGETLRADIHIQPFGKGGNMFIVVLNEVQGSNETRTDHILSGSNRSIAGMAAVLAHEIKTPLSGIRGSAQLLEQQASDDDLGLTRIIVDECDRIRALVDSMETFSDPQPLRTKPQNIHKIIDHVMTLAKASFASKLAVETRFDPSLPSISGDRDSLVQAFLNLVKNAAEAMADENGRLILSTRYRHGAKVHDQRSNAVINTPIEITVADNGAGIPTTLLDHIFEPFVTGKPGGKGLGLALVQKIIADHKGSILAENTATGARFTVVLPEARQEELGE